MKGKIFVVDDEYCIRHTLDRLFLHYDYEPHIFSKPSLARAELERDKISPLMYLVDMRIPGELKGSEALFEYVVSHNLAPERFFFMTGNVSKHDCEVLERTGAPVLEKPFNPDWLRDYIANTVSKLDNHYSSIRQPELFQ